VSSNLSFFYLRCTVFVLCAVLFTYGGILLLLTAWRHFSKHGNRFLFILLFIPSGCFAILYHVSFFSLILSFLKNQHETHQHFCNLSFSSFFFFLFMSCYYWEWTENGRWPKNVPFTVVALLAIIFAEAVSLSILSVSSSLLSYLRRNLSHKSTALLKKESFT
jgi:hypothetical protein